MVNYKLAICDNKNNYKEIVLKSNFKFLWVIDEFTGNFENEEELKQYLLNKNLINTDDYKNNLSIIYTYQKKIKKLPIIYFDQKRYLDEELIRYKIKSLSNNLDFLEKLANHYNILGFNQNPQSANIEDIKYYIRCVEKNNSYDDLNELLFAALDDLILKAISNYNKNTQKRDLNYRGLRDLGLFIYRFIETKNLKNKKKDIISQNDNSIIYNSRNLNNIEDDDYLEPMFIPNTNEKELFETYLESLEDEDFEGEFKKLKKLT